MEVIGRPYLLPICTSSAPVYCVLYVKCLELEHTQIDACARLVGRASFFFSEEESL